MKAVLITIGDEILSGNTIDTNSNFIATQLKSVGIEVLQIFTISDEVTSINKALKDALDIADLVITTGGIGPTRDDKTKAAFAKFFNDSLVLDPETYLHLEKILEKRKRSHLLELNKSQAEVLSKAIVFQNENGTAPCQMIKHNGRLIFSLPGVPYEVKPLIKDKIIPFLKDNYKLQHIFTRIVSVINVPESLLAERIKDWEDQLPLDTSLSYLPIGSRIKLRLTAKGANIKTLEETLETEIEKLTQIIGDNIIATHEDKIEKILQEILIDRKLTIACAESCTGGELAKLLSSTPGSSAVFNGGIVTYATAMKIDILKVSAETIANHTVVSEEVALEMAEGAQQIFGTDITVSTTGVAGPGKGEDGKDVGTVYYAISIKDKSEVFKLYLPHLERGDFTNFVSQRVIQDVVALLIKDA